MSFFAIACVVALVSVGPLLLMRMLRAACYVGPIVALFAWCLFYLNPPKLAQPLWGGAWVAALVVSLVVGLVVLVSRDSGGLNRETVFRAMAVPALCMAVMSFRVIGSLGAFNASDYNAMLGTVETREWTEDVQPKDQHHVRKVPANYAAWVANKQLGAADNAIGSQFEIDTAHMTIQMVREDLWYIVPLKFKDFGTWNQSNGVPGYVMVSAEDAHREPETVFSKAYAYMPSAYFSHELERHLWTHGLNDVVFADFTFEVDDEGSGWWVVTLARPTIGWSAQKVEGVAIVDPTSGEFKTYGTDAIPAWVDRVMPSNLLAERITWRGIYHAGWLNSWYGESNNSEPETMTFVHGSDGQPYFVADITSTGLNDDALIGLMYVNARSGKATYYKVKGMTTTAALQTVNAKVSFRHWHGEDPVLYNLYGTKADIVPLLADNNTYQGVAIVDIEKDQNVVFGTDMLDALRQYQRLLSGDTEASPEIAKARVVVTGTVARFSRESGPQGTQYYLLLKDGRKAFTAGPGLSPKLSLTKEGDTVSLTYVDSGEAVEPLIAFENSSLPLDGKMTTENK